MKLKKLGLDVPQTIGFIIIHLVAIWGLLKTPFHVSYLRFILALYFFKFFGFSGIHHRYFSHKAFKTSRLFQFVLSLWGNCTFMRGPHRFASGHRHHHRYSDAENDLHSPKNGLWQGWMGWFLDKSYHESNLESVDDLKKFPELEFINNHFYFVPWVASNLIIYLLGGLPALFWIGMLTTLLVWHVCFLTGIFFHKFGYQTYATDDDSRNNPLLCIITMGESWHNNHHQQMHAANVGHTWKQIDLTFYIIVAFESLGLVWDVKRRHSMN
ncbi:MAG: acyl-CoA desaturase [Bacteriovoracaceae bacterium]